MKKLRNVLFLVAAISGLVSCDLTTVPEDSMIPERYFTSAASLEQWLNNCYTQFDGYGIMVSGPGWKQIGGNWYYPDASGAMQTGWLTLGSSTYCLNSAGVMLKNTTVTVGGKTYTLNAYGIRQ